MHRVWYVINEKHEDRAGTKGMKPIVDGISLVSSPTTTPATTSSTTLLATSVMRWWWM